MGINTISILPHSIKEQRKIKREIVTILSIAVLISVVLLVCGIAALKYRLFIESNLSFVSSRKELIELTIEDNEENIEIANTLSELKKIIEKEMGAVPDWENVIYQITNTIPNELYIEEMEAGFEEENFVILRGYSDDLYAVNHFIELLNSIQSVNDTEIIYINKLPVEKENFMGLEIKITVSGTPYSLRAIGEE